MKNYVLMILILKIFINKEDSSLNVVNSILYPDGKLPKQNKVEGDIFLLGKTYHSTCECSNKKIEGDLQGCNPKELKIRKDNEIDSDDIDEKLLKKFVGKFEDITWNKVDKNYFSCMDGRIKDKTQSTPGGDLGEFLLALHIYETYFPKKKNLNFKQVKKYLRWYLKTMNSNYFYMCTDEVSIDHLEKELGVTGININNPRNSIKKELLNSLLNSHNIGSQHFKMLLNFNQKYNISKKLVKNSIKAFFHIYWNDKKLKKKLKLEILTGYNNELAFIEINSNPICTKNNLAPIFNHFYKDNQFLINNVDAILIRRAELTYFFINNINHHSDPINAVVFYNRMNKIGREFLEITIRHVAKNLPLFTINLL